MIRLRLPYPPSVNNYWRTVVQRKGRRHVPRVYVADPGVQYRHRIIALLHGVPTIATGWVAVAVQVFPPDRRQRDIDNVLKCLLDSLTHAGLWGDDSQVASLLIERCEVRAGGLVVVEVEETKLKCW